jgi:hypothetical protein
MPTLQEKGNVASAASSSAQHYSRMVKLVQQAAKSASEDPPLSVEIFNHGDKWYCQVRRGEQMTQPMGPYTKRQAERIQDARRMLIAKRGAARLVFE